MDSLKSVLDTLQDDKKRVVVLNQLGFRYARIAPIKSTELGAQAVKIAERIDYKEGIARSYNTIAMGHHKLSDYELALEYYFKALEIRREFGSKGSVATTLNNLGLLYIKQKKYELAKKTFYEVVAIRKKGKSKKRLASVYNNLGIVHSRMAQFDSALFYYQETLAIKKAYKSKKGLATNLFNIGLTYERQQYFDSALVYYTKVLPMREANADTLGLANTFNAMGNCFSALGQHKKALEYLQRSEKFVDAINSLQLHIQTKEAYANYYENKGDFKNALEAYQDFHYLHDSLFNETQSEQFAKLQTVFEVAQKEKENELLTQQKLTAEAQREEQIVITLAVGLGLVFISLIAGILSYTNRQKQETNNLLNEKNVELEQQQEEIVAQNDYINDTNKKLRAQNFHITQSIEAALLIQKTLLPFEDRVNDFLKSHFAIFRPKDVVSGDFYWIEQVDNQIIIAVVDCTGHGVPGAFMAMIAQTLLDKVVMVDKITNPSQILEALHQDSHYTLEKNTSENHFSYGMDVALTVLSYLPNGDADIQFAGAKRSLYYIKPLDNQIEKIAGSRIYIGSNKQGVFPTQHITLPADTQLYMFSDGFTDQNNKDRKKFGTKRFLQLLKKNAPYDFKMQKQILENTLDEFMLGTEQRDDILVLGVKV